METNLFGALWVTKAALPILREQGSGHIIQVSSIGGVNAFPTLGLYHASKWALEAIHAVPGRARSREFGIKVTIVEPTGYPTDWAGPVRRSSGRAARLRRGARSAGRGVASQARAERRPGGDRPGDPRGRRRRGAAAARSSSASGTLEMIRTEYARRLATWEQWDDVSQTAHGNP